MTTRRTFVKSVGAATLAALAAPSPRAEAAEKPGKLKPRADAMIFLFMAGGMASTETFDPKHYESFSPNVEAKRVLSTFPAIDTPADNIKISAGLENIAKVMDKCCLIRDHAGRQPGEDSTFTSSVSFTHRLCAPGFGSRAAFRRLDCPHTGSAESGCPGVHRYRRTASGRVNRRSSRRISPADSSAANTARSASPSPSHRRQ